MSLSSFRSVFASFLADLMHMAITRPITVQIAGVVSVCSARVAWRMRRAAMVAPVE